VRHIFSGILPRPDTLQAYQSSVPDIAERLVALAEREQAHRHSHEDDMHAIIRKEAEHEYQFRFRGDALALTILFTCVAFAALLWFTGADAVPVACLVGTPVLSGLGALLAARRSGSGTKSRTPQH
jgi:uncharacterized membrane protein